MSPERDEAARLRDDPGRREDLRGRLDRYLDAPLVPASVLMVLLAVIELSGEVGGPWRWSLATLGWSLGGLFFVELAVKLALAPVKRSYLGRSWLDVLVLLVPFLRFLKVLGLLRPPAPCPSSGSRSSGAGARGAP